jgi:hypothetical protein
MNKSPAEQNLDDIVLPYLRKCKHRLQSTTGNADAFDFDDLFKNVIRAIERNTGTSIFEKVYRCNTFSADSRIIHNKTCTLVGAVYDTALADILGSLVILYLHNACFDDYKKYTCKLLAENLFNASNLVDALKMVELYSKQEYHMKEPLSGKPYQSAKQYAAIQYAFVLYHEIGHILHKHSFSKQKSDEYEARLIKIVRASNGSETEIEGMVKYIQTHKLLIEECYCDCYALELLFNFSIGENNYHPNDIAIAAYLTTSFQNYIQLITNHAQGVKIEIAERATFSFLRKLSMRNWIPFFYCRYFEGESPAISKDEWHANQNYKNVSNKLDEIERYFRKNLYLDEVNSTIESFNIPNNTLDIDFDEAVNVELQKLIENLD